MADLIQFHCPACGVVLRLPLPMAGQEGPCPRCSQLIVAPEPQRGFGARVTASPEKSSRTAAMWDHTPLPAEAPPQTSGNQAATGAFPPTELPPERNAADEVRQRPQLAVFVLSLLLTAVVSLLSGFLLGSGTIGMKAALASLETKPIVPNSGITSDPPPKVVIARPPADVPLPPAQPAVPRLEPASTPASQPESVKASAAAEAALRAFLEAPDWTTRSTHVLFRERLKTAMESYSHKMPDGPTSYTEIKRKDTFMDRETGASFFIFYVCTEKHPDGFPTVVAETNSGWLVDWEAFVEFRDDQFKTFCDGPAGQSGKFHLLVTAPPPSRAANTENEYFASFLIGPPGADSARIAYVKKNAGACARLTESTKDGAVFAPVVEVSKRTTPEGKSYLEIDSVVASRWLPDHAE